jgi:cyclopropane fatty-acyl-phospholipid synthase-like methyltransferase
MKSRKEHWENVYKNKSPQEVSWTQQLPKTSLEFISSFRLPKSASIIDIGGGDSRLVDYLIDQQYENISVLDISEKAIEKAKERLGEKAAKVKWIISDVTEFQPETNYDCWHDRATFHFLTSSSDIDSYLGIARKAVNKFMVIGTFSETGPDKCSMLEVHKYSEEELQHQLENGFEKIKCITEDHTTPFNTTQNFLFCSFRKQQSKAGTRI